MENIVIIDGKKYRKTKNGGRLLVMENKFLFLPKHAGVYLITDLTTGMKYVGSSSNVNKRAHNYLKLSDYKNARGVLKYLNPDKIKIELLEDCRYLSVSDRLKLEGEWIVKLNTLKPNGYNCVIPTGVKKKKIKHEPVKNKFLNKANTNIFENYKGL